jgi:uncharacterized protein with ATP-grasp and redox domains
LPLRSDPRCLDCFRSGLGVFLGKTGIPQATATELLEGYLARIEAVMRSEPPPVAGAPVYREIRELAPHPDLYRAEKAAATSALVGRMGQLRGMVTGEDDPLRASLRACTWGNLLDVAQGRALPGEEELVDMLSAPLALDDTASFAREMARASSLLILGDNAGETVLDRLFLEVSGFGGAIHYAVRPGPVLNDAVEGDAVYAGLHRLSTLLDTGYDAPTVVRGRLAPAMESLLDGADLVLSKGQGNFEGLLGTGDERLYYSLVVKCPVIGEILGLPVGSGVFVSSRNVPEGHC